MDGDSSLYLLSILIIAVVVLTLLLVLLVWICRETLAKSLGAFFWKKEVIRPDEVEEEIISMVKEGHEQGVLQESEAEMIHNIFAFDDKEAKDIMTHRKNLIALDGELSYIDAVGQMHETKRSRYPVYEEDIDHITGVLHIKDAFAFVQRNELYRTSIQDIPGLVREVDFIPETMKINDLFQTMQAAKSHMAIVVDEYGQTAGIVAMEDILEEIVGNIEDEHDEAEEYVKENIDGSYRMDGLTEFSDVVELLSLEIPQDAFDTLNGYLISLLEKIPSEGEQPVVCAGGYEFSIRRVEDRVIREVEVRKKAEAVRTDDGKAERRPTGEQV